MGLRKDFLGIHCSEILGEDGTPLLRSPSDWKWGSIERKEIPIRAECGPQVAGYPTIIASRFSPGRRWYRSNGVTREVPMNFPGVDLLPANYERDYGKWDCGPGGETVVLKLSPSYIERNFQKDIHQTGFETKFSFKDDKLVDALFSLADELQQDTPNGMMFADGMTMSIVGWLLKHHARKNPLESLDNGSSGLTAKQQASVREFVATSLAGDLSVETIAAKLNISPFHFSRLFRTSFGMAPHQYVLKMRIDRAARLLRSDSRRSISDIAMAVGFSSQSHLTNAFKRCVGESPARWRQLHD
ncbi:helix-turn-helix domain-containing protein [Propionivibrio dicarboxylicus]|uniref:Helix-turn-helix domain-containing protein n=1 Tax=Propionivibrio dicarboxylicus TaxID=83767 RepID=A0A1G8AKA0_9RHOO|nr:AraC family transcriptional regulator [Propionivibrio dicarboxylicus]SDH21381.1 Helix-turn-helix domain-containing protein [Propionivibrio dicarboxylicus]